MIKSIRVDYRLLHGQIAVSWTSTLGADCLLLVSDTVKDDPLRSNALKLAKPAGVKVVIKNTEDSIKAITSGVTDKYKLFVICETLEIAKRLMEAIGETKLNIGNTPFREGTNQYGKSANLTEAELDMIKEMIGGGMELYIQMIPTEKIIKCESIIK
jgi:fructoselysine and glucoselysine-specific PTS system IIB component